jgi:hypothetical protein
MAEAQAPNPSANGIQNPLDTWRQFITDSERQWNGFFKDVLGTDAFSNSMNAWVEGSLTGAAGVAARSRRQRAEETDGATPAAADQAAGICCETTRRVLTG